MKLTGIPIKGVKLKGNKLEKQFHFRDYSHKLRCKKSKKVRVAKRGG